MTPGGGRTLRERLGALVRARRTPSTRPAPPAARAPRREPERSVRSIEQVLPGTEWRSPRHGAVHVHERRRGEIERARATWGRLPEPPPGETELTTLRLLGLDRVLFLDLETCGLSSSPVFLAGTMHWDGRDFIVRQVFARHYGEEAALLDAVAHQASGFEALVTFNGKSYDVPFLHARATLHGVALQMPRHHFDLLHHSRRRWAGQFADCRLGTLEKNVCGRRRTGDVPGREIPDRYHDFVREGDPVPMGPVFHHNLLDVLTMADLLHALCRPARSRARP
jgi:uncharacterized protein YprB with RNaseH-like and TPR domain